MTKRSKMGLYTGKTSGPYNGKATLCLLQENRLENLKTKMRRKLNKARKQATDLTQKVKLLHEEELKRGGLYSTC